MKVWNKLNGYSWYVGSIYVFNSMFGIGFLTLVKPFAEVGWLLGLISLGILVLTSYTTATFLLETQAIYNALLFHRLNRSNDIGLENAQDVLKKEEEACQKVTKEEIDENRSLLPSRNSAISDDDLFVITVDAGFGDLCKRFFHKVGFISVYITVAVFMYGVQAVYITVISVSLTSVICGDTSKSLSSSSTSCLNYPNFKAMQMYRINVTVFILFWAPFIFFNITKIKIVQVFSLALRFISLISMIWLALMSIKSEGKIRNPRVAKLNELPNFLSKALFVYNCHIEFPSFMSPIINKKRMKLATVLPFISAFLLSIFLSMSLVFVVPPEEMQDLITLNFTKPVFFKYLLQLFPVFTLLASAPTGAVVLRDQLKTLVLTKNEEEYNVFVRRFLFPICVIIPPVTIAYSTANIGLLVSYISGYVGGVLLFVVPVLLVYHARKEAAFTFNDYKNKYQSPLRHNAWLVIILIWYLGTLAARLFYQAHNE